MDFSPASGPAIPVGSGYTVKSYPNVPEISPMEAHDAYFDALKKVGWTIGANYPNEGVYAHFDKNGRDIYARVRYSEGRPFDMFVADVGSELKATLAKNCKAAVYGINFDFDKATLRPDSEPTLTQVLRLLRDEPKLTVEIGGHTDNVGKADYNMKLSDRRAATVREWLVGHGIAASRLTSRGYGDTQPLVPNDSDENRAKNRRVELKKPNCR
jgi:outer membrane protein OmpA-like peptidoglycan-associated protein